MISLAPFSAPIKNLRFIASVASGRDSILPTCFGRFTAKKTGVFLPGFVCLSDGFVCHGRGERKPILRLTWHHCTKQCRSIPKRARCAHTSIDRVTSVTDVTALLSLLRGGSRLFLPLQFFKAALRVQRNRCRKGLLIACCQKYLCVISDGNNNSL